MSVSNEVMVEVGVLGSEESVGSEIIEGAIGRGRDNSAMQ